MIAESFIKASVGTTQMPANDKWVNAMWYKHTMEYSVVIDRNNPLTHAAMRTNPENLLRRRGRLEDHTWLYS